MTDEEKIDVKIHNSQPQPPSQLQPQMQPHNGSPISWIEVSQNIKYLVSYSEDDDSIVGWEIKNNKLDEKDKNDEKVEEEKIKFKSIINKVGRVLRMCISNDNILAYTYLSKNYFGENVKISKYN